MVRTVEYLRANEWVMEAGSEGLRAGLWHLGTVTAGCLASVGHEVTWA